MKINRPVILDSSALIAQINLADSLHEKAQAINTVLSQTERQVILPYEVFAEAMNIFGKKVGRIEAARAGKAILARHATGSLVIATSSAPILDAALELLQTAKGQSPSFVDCLVMVYADVHKTTEVFGFDETFAKNGYQLPAAPNKQQAA